MRWLLFYSLTVMCCSPGLLLASPATTNKADVLAPQESQDNKKTQATSPARSETVRTPPRSERKPTATAAQTVLTFFEKEGEERFGITEPQKEIRILREERDPDFHDRRIVRVQQLIRGVPVFGSDTTMVVKPGKRVVSLTSGLTPQRDIANVETTPTIKWFEAVGRAIEHYRQIVVKAKESIQLDFAQTEAEPRPITTQLIIFDPTKLGLKADVARLTWMVRLGTFVMFVDARDGSLVFRYRDLQSARDRLTYDLNGGVDLGHNLVLNENGPTGGSSQVPVDAWKAHNNAARFYEFFWKKFGRDSYNNAGGVIESNVRHDHSQQAQWHILKLLIYGPQYPNALDIGGHEFTHGVIQHSAKLTYFDESGALNEGFADFFGAAIEGAYQTHNWTIGEDLPEGLIRDMANPHNGGFDPKEVPSPTNPGQPDHYSEKVTIADDICGYSSDIENGCVHFNSGIFNKAAYLASAGGMHHSVQVTGVGKSKMMRILYRSLVARLRNSSNMSEAAELIVKACTDLVGQYKITTANCNQVQKAFEAVGLPVP